MPILLAIRDLEFPVIYDFPDRSTIKNYNFKKEDELTLEEINKYSELAEKSGLFEVFSLVSSFHDYILGVEVGMDTNAHKNRSGQIMEKAMYPIVKNICSSKHIDFHFQEKFKVVGEKYKVKAPKDTPNRKPDFILQKGGKFVNIEVNFFNKSGSKPEEIIESYSNRRNKLLSAGWGFIFITDGNVWNKSLNQLKNGFENIDYLLNLDFVGKGMLEAALKEIFSK
jgi:type II restriction enzyme